MVSEKDKERTRIWKAKQKATGGCVDCKEKVVPGFIRCQKHLDDRNNRRGK